MTDQTAQEPTMEEILASIRRIISEDDAPAETASSAPLAEPEPEPFAAAEPEPEVVAEHDAPEDDVLELTERFEAPVAESIGDLDVVEASSQPEPETDPDPEPFLAAETAAEPSPASAPQPVFDTLVGDSAAASAASAFAGLAASFQKTEPASPRADLNFASGSTVEAMVADMLRPMLKEWLDANLADIVEAQVRREVERIARTAG